MTEGTAHKYKGFLIVEKPPETFKAYRSPVLWDREVTSYEAKSRADIGLMIDNAEDQGDFDPALGPPAVFFEHPTRYPDYIMAKVRQRLGLESEDTSKDSEINAMTHNTIMDHCLEWEGILHYGPAIRVWIKGIYGVELD